MDRVWGANASQTPPDIPADAPLGYPTDGSASGGLLATVPKAFWYHMIAEEIRAAIVGFGVTPDRSDLSQLSKAIKKGIQEEAEARDSAIGSVVAELTRVITLNVDRLNQRIDAIEGFRPGMIAYFARSTPPSDRWLVCDGRAVSRAVYPELFAAIGTRYGGGNGSITFNLPNGMDRVPWGSTGAGCIDAGLPEIWGAIKQWKFVGAEGAFHYDGAGWGGSQTHDGGGDPTFRVEFNASRSNAIYGRSHTVQPPAVRLLPCIHV